MPSAITMSPSGGGLNVPNDPIIPFIEGDGTGPDIWKASVRVFDAAVDKAYSNRPMKLKIHWQEVLAGEKAFNKTGGNWLPDETLDAFPAANSASRSQATSATSADVR
jgi:isocitrate dehydrogenase